jgi:hypothetical protein
VTSGGLVTATADGPSGTNTTENPSQGPADVSWSAEASAVDLFFEGQPFNRDDVLMVMSVLTLLLLAYRTFNQ